MAKMFMLQTDCRVINKIYCKGALTPDPPLWSPVHFLICFHLTRRGGPSNKNQRLLFMLVNGSVLSHHPWCQSCRRFPNLRWAKRLAKWRAYVSNGFSPKRLDNDKVPSWPVWTVWLGANRVSNRMTAPASWDEIVKRSAWPCFDFTSSLTFRILSTFSEERKCQNPFFQKGIEKIMIVFQWKDLRACFDSLLALKPISWSDVAEVFEHPISLAVRVCTHHCHVIGIGDFCFCFCLMIRD